MISGTERPLVVLRLYVEHFQTGKHLTFTR